MDYWHGFFEGVTIGIGLGGFFVIWLFKREMARRKNLYFARRGL